MGACPRSSRPCVADEPPVPAGHPHRRAHGAALRRPGSSPAALRARSSPPCPCPSGSWVPAHRAPGPPRLAGAPCGRRPRRQPHGILVFPEGHRTPDGEIQPFKTAGLELMLRERPLPVYLVVTDGFWTCRRLRGLPVQHAPDRRADGGAGPVRARAGPGPGGVPGGLRDRMAAHLRRMREARACIRLSPHGDATRDAIRARALPVAADPDAAAVARAVAAAGAGVRAILFFGSRKTRARPGRLQRLRSLRAHRRLSRLLPVACAARARCAVQPGPRWPRLNAVLPPNQVSVPATLADGTPARAKCAVVTLAGFAARDLPPPRATTSSSAGLFQPTELVYAADDEAEGAGAGGARRAPTSLTYDWVRPWLPARVRRRRLLPDASAGLLRRRDPAGAGGAGRGPVAGPGGIPAAGLRRGSWRTSPRAGELADAERGTYAPARPASAGERPAASALLPVVAGPGHGPLGQIHRHLRRTGWSSSCARRGATAARTIVLTPRERRLPLVFLWPRVIHYLRHKDQPLVPAGLVVFAGVLAVALVSMAVYALGGRRARRRRLPQGLDVPPGRGRLPRPLVHVGPRAGRALVPAAGAEPRLLQLRWASASER